MAAVKASEARGHPLLVRAMELPRLPSNAPAGLLLRFGERKPLSAPGSGFCLRRRLRRILFGRLCFGSNVRREVVDFHGDMVLLLKCQLHRPGQDPQEARQAGSLSSRAFCSSPSSPPSSSPCSSRTARPWWGSSPPPSSSAAHHAGGPKRQLHRRPLLYYAHAAPAGVRLAAPIGPAVVAVDPHAVITTANAKHTPSNFVLAYY
jgi:hypothetical protein